MLVNGVAGQIAVVCWLWFGCADAGTPLNSTQLMETVVGDALTGFGIGRYSFSQIFRLFTAQHPPPAPRAWTEPHFNKGETNFEIAESLFYGQGGVQRNLTRAAEYYRRAADVDGDADAQYMVGLAYSTGLFGSHEENNAMATLYYTMAALNGNTRGQITLGYRYLNGISMPQDFEQAYTYLQSAANDCLDYYEDVPGLGFKSEANIPFAIADEYDGGLFGPVSDELRLERSPIRSLLAEFSSVQAGVDWLLFGAYEENNPKALRHLVHVAYHAGADGMSQPDYELAASRAQELLDVTDKDMSQMGRVRNAWANGFLGDCYRQGHGRPIDFEVAKEYYQAGLAVAPEENIEDKNIKVRQCAACHTGLGLIEMYELENQPDLDENSLQFDRVRTHFYRGSLLKQPVSQYYMAASLYETGHLDEAVTMLKDSSPIFPPAGFLLARIYYAYGEADPVESSRNAFIQSAAEELLRVCHSTPELYSPLRFAQNVYDKDLGASLVALLIPAELGYSAAQVNIADALDVQHSALPIPWLSKWPLPDFVSEKSRATTALKYFALAGQSKHSDALYKVAEYYYYGYGVEQDMSAAASLYRILTRDSYRHSMAYWALGYMHENGLGIPQDFHLAKRFYDSACYYQSYAYFTTKLSLFILYIRSFVGKLMGTKVNTIPARVSINHGKSWYKAFMDAKKRLDYIKEKYAATEVNAEPEPPAAGGEQPDVGALLVDISILAAVMAIIGSILWMRRRRGAQ